MSKESEIGFVRMEQTAYERGKHEAIDNKPELSELSLTDLARISTASLVYETPHSMAEALATMDQQTRKTQARAILAERAAGALGTPFAETVWYALPNKFKKEYGSIEVKPEPRKKPKVDPFYISPHGFNTVRNNYIRQKPSKLPR